MLLHWLLHQLPLRSNYNDDSTMPLTAAFSDFDISVIPLKFSPDPTNNNPCIQINLVNDNLVEEDEYFIVQLSGGNEAIDVLANTLAQVTITDDDGMRLKLVRAA